MAAASTKPNIDKARPEKPETISSSPAIAALTPTKKPPNSEGNHASGLYFSGITIISTTGFVAACVGLGARLAGEGAVPVGRGFGGKRGGPVEVFLHRLVGSAGESRIRVALGDERPFGGRIGVRGFDGTRQCGIDIDRRRRTGRGGFCRGGTLRSADRCECGGEGHLNLHDEQLAAFGALGSEAARLGEVRRDRGRARGATELHGVAPANSISRGMTR